jgi:hypothetical protein
MLKSIALTVLFGFTVFLQAAPQYTYTEPFPGAPVAYQASDGRNVYLKADEETRIRELDAFLSSQPKDDAVGFQIGPEIGFSAWDTKQIDYEAGKDFWIKYFNFFGWTTAKGTVETNFNNIYWGLSGSANWEKFRLLGGVKFFDLGNGTLTVSDTGSLVSGVAQYHKYTQTESASFYTPYIGMYFKEQLNSKFHFGVGAEFGLAYLEGKMASKRSWYNGSYYDYYYNAEYKSDATYYALMTNLQYNFVKGLFGEFDLGYKFANFTKLKVSKADTNYPASYGMAAVGDTVKSYAGGDYKFDLKGLMAAFKVIYQF